MSTQVRSGVGHWVSGCSAVIREWTQVRAAHYPRFRCRPAGGSPCPKRPAEVELVFCDDCDVLRRHPPLREEGRVFHAAQTAEGGALMTRDTVKS